MVQTFNQAQKSKELQQYFQAQGRIHIVVDTCRDDVILPGHLKGNPALRLVLNCRMPHPIHFFHNRIESNFSFSGVSSLCVIPIAAIWAAHHPEIQMEEGLIWESDIPDVLLANVTEKAQSEEVPAPQASPQAEKNKHDKPVVVRHLRVVK